MNEYKTPGVYIQEISKIPPSVAAVETAIPAFIGFTEKDKDDNGVTLVHKPVRITSLLEFVEIFGNAKINQLNVDVTQTKVGDAITETKVTFNGTPPTLPDDFLFYSMQMFYANGGGPCYIVSTGAHGTAFKKKLFTDAIEALKGVDEPTLLVFPDGCSKGSTINDIKDIVDAALKHCKEMQDRFAIVDVFDAIKGKTDTIAKVENFRSPLTNDLSDKKYGAAYMPYLKTTLPFRTDDKNIVVKTHKITTIKPDGTTKVDPGSITANAKLDSIKEDHTEVYNAVQRFVSSVYVTIPPSGAVAGSYARVDNERGVWKAPANVSLKSVLEPAFRITNDMNDRLNVIPGSGKSVNAIRAFSGKGILVWGARTLAGNDNENRYVPVRRFLIFAEESIKKAMETFTFEPNDANTWTKVRSMIESFLAKQWRNGALAGAKTEDAFYVEVGLNKTMSAQDILEGRMIVEIGLAIVRPAEFIILQFVQMMQKS